MKCIARIFISFSYKGNIEHLGGGGVTVMNILGFVDGIVRKLERCYRNVSDLSQYLSTKHSIKSHRTTDSLNISSGRTNRSFLLQSAHLTTWAQRAKRNRRFLNRKRWCHASLVSKAPGLRNEHPVASQLNYLCQTAHTFSCKTEYPIIWRKLMIVSILSRQRHATIQVAL